MHIVMINTLAIIPSSFNVAHHVPSLSHVILCSFSPNPHSLEEPMRSLKSSLFLVEYP